MVTFAALFFNKPRRKKMSTKAQVQADVKAIAARRADGMHIDQRSLRYEKQKERKIADWRQTHVKAGKQQGHFIDDFAIPLTIMAVVFAATALICILTQ
jgi:hypothetical protein